MAHRFIMRGIRVQDLLISDEELLEDSAGKGKQIPGQRSAPPELKYFLIEFIHDTICPFCYIGFRNLLAAIEKYKEKHPDAVFEVTCTPSILAPDAKVSCCNKYNYYFNERKLPPSRLAVWNKLGADAGFKFSWNGLTGNSNDSHKLLRFALQKTPTTERSTRLAEYGPLVEVPLYPPYSMRAPAQPVSLPQPRGPDLQMRLSDAITTGYHEHDKDLSDRRWLIEITKAVTGFPEEEIRAVLESPEWDATISRLSVEVGNRISVRNQAAGPLVAVPTIVINEKWVYGGFQGVNETVSQFELLRQMMNPQREYTKSSLVLEGGLVDTLAREAALAARTNKQQGNPSNSR